ncbi:TonB-dependent receptor domain-containing protein [Bacteriovorax sp. Seq25_V]|uniref:TonB-dependent receptor domain-containing protein n=1 Tax=Bacteriovorax sp. Seq25_V TaxID=1201288 RepID=UPI000389E85D|nr:TonB-dependent receptor [Bacteriovorax sp. Seq25_V]EQC47995.1 TonB-dependent receptor [Bacteriovorax sp. Seq25_V]
MKQKFIAMLPIILLGQSYGQDGVYNLETVNIYEGQDSGQQLQLSSDVESNSFDYLGQDYLSNTNNSSLDDILKFSSNATTSGGPRSSGEAIQVRGLQASKLYMYVDGVKQSFRTDHNTMMAIDTANIKEVKIDKDTSNFSRSGSVGGGVSLRTIEATDYLNAKEDFGASIQSSQQGSNKEKYVGIKIYGKDKKSNYILSVGNRDASNIVLGDRSTLPHSNFEDDSFLAKYKFNYRNFDFLLQGDYFTRQDNVPINPTLDPPEDDLELNGDNTIKRTTQLVGVDLRKQQLELRASNTDQKLTKVRKSDKQIERRDINSKQLSLKKKTVISKVSLLSGVEFLTDTLSGNRNIEKLESYPSGESRQKSIYVDGVFVSDYFDLSAGLKYQDYKLNSNKFSERGDNGLLKKAGVRFKPTQALTLSVNYSEGFNAPKVQDVFADGLHHPGDGFFIADNYFIPNEDLKVERSKTIEVGVKYERNLFSSEDLISLTASRYWSHIDDYISLEKIDRAIFDGENGTTQSVNIDLVSLTGDELGLGYIYDQFESRISYTKIRGTNKILGLYIADLPADHYNFYLAHHLDQYSFDYGYQSVLSLKQDRINRETTERTDETPRSFVHNVFLSKGFFGDVVKINMNFDNITNRRYRKHASNIMEAGRDYKISFEYKVNFL